MMDFYLIVTCAICLIISLMLIYNYFKYYQNDKIKKISNWLSLSSLGYLLLAILFFSWSMNFIHYSVIDFNIIYSAILIFIVLIFLKMIFLFTQDFKIYIYFIIFILINLFSIIITDKFYLIVMPLSYLTLLLLSFNYFLRRKECKLFGYFLAIYASFSLLSQALNILDIINSQILISISFLLYSLVVFAFIKNANDFPSNIEKIKYHKESKWISFIRYFVFVLILFNLILLGTVVIHESGHIFSAKFLGCDYKTYIFEDDGRSLQTETFCSTPTRGLFVALGGIFLPFILALVFYFVGGRLSNAISLIIFGSGIIISSADLVVLEISNNLIISLDFVAVILIIWGVVKLSKYKFNEVF